MPPSPQDTRRDSNLTIIAACSDSKTVPVPDRLQLRDIVGSPSHRAVKWRERINSDTHDRRPASELYAGAHWAAILQTVGSASANGWSPSLWVASAGLGLVHQDDLVPAYSATFSPGGADSVRRSADEGTATEVAQNWWDSVSQRELADAAQGGNAPILVIAGAVYIDAMAASLNEVDQDRLVIICTGIGAEMAKRSSLGNTVLRTNAVLRHAVGGSLNALNARIAHWIVRTIPRDQFERATIQRSLNELANHAKALSPQRVIERPRLDDDQLVTITVAMLREHPGLARTRALSMLRHVEGIACEQGRFKLIYEQAVSSLKPIP